MKILATTYAVNPYKGSEDGMGWNFILQIARFNEVITVTRKNNRENIETYMKENPSELYKNITFLYFDLPYWMRFWKRGNKGALIYYYLWQMTIPLFIKKKNISFDITHNVNFHNDWTPSFLWGLGKPMVWGPIGHHPYISPTFLKKYSKKVQLKNKLTWFTKNLFWKLDPFLMLTKWNAKKIISMNSEVATKLKGIKHKEIIMPSVSSEKQTYKTKEKNYFNILSVGRLIPLKGFDLTIQSFHTFLSTLQEEEKKQVTLTIVGSGSHESFYKKLVLDLGLEKSVKFISWIKRENLKKIYQNASLFLFPSHEGAGMVVSEALSFGLPVISLDNCGPGEFINDTCGIKVEQKNYSQTVNQLAEGITNLYTNKNTRLKLSQGAIKHFDTNFNWNLKGNKLNDIYLEVLKTKKSSKTNLFTSLLN